MNLTGKIEFSQFLKAFQAVAIQVRLFVVIIPRAANKLEERLWRLRLWLQS